MKMNKILAAGVAASLAVTSLAAVASAAERTFPMKYTEGKYTYNPVANKEINIGLDATYGFKTYVPSALASGALDVAGNDGAGVVNHNDFDAFLPVVVKFNHTTAIDSVGDLVVEINGRKYDNGNLVAITRKAKLIEYKVVDAAGKFVSNYILPMYVDDAPEGCFMPNEFAAFDSIKISVDSLKAIDVYAIDEVTYNNIGKYKDDWSNWPNPEMTDLSTKTTYVAENGTYALYKDDIKKDENGNYKQDVYGYDAERNITDVFVSFELAGTVNTVNYTRVFATSGMKATGTAADAPTSAGTLGDIITVDKTNKVITIKDADKAAQGANIVRADADPEETNYYKVIAGTPEIFNTIINLIGDIGFEIKWHAASGETYDNDAWLPRTCFCGDRIIYRNEVKLLSDTEDYKSINRDYLTDGNQTYDEVDYNKGKNPYGFAGLASQVADFFNKQLNGTITFHFAAGKTAAGNGWLNGGIPSTEVGVKNAITGMTNNDVALFVNYGSTTGSLQAVTEVKAEELAVTFDISDILDALNGQTIGTVQDIYYGMSKGVKYDVNGAEVEGFFVDTVTLAYDEDASDEDITDGDEDEGDADGEDEGDEGDVEVDGDEDEGDGEVDGDTDEDDFPTEGDEETGDDENPGTGVALAVVPALMAAAAVVVSKKRK